MEEPKEKEAEPIEAVKEAPKKTGLPEGAIIKSTEELNKEKRRKRVRKQVLESHPLLRQRCRHL